MGIFPGNRPQFPVGWAFPGPTASLPDLVGRPGYHPMHHHSRGLAAASWVERSTALKRLHSPAPGNRRTDGRWPPSRAFLRPPLPVIVGRCGGLRSLPRFLGGDADVWSRQASAFCWSSRPPPVSFSDCDHGDNFLSSGASLPHQWRFDSHLFPARDTCRSSSGLSGTQCTVVFICLGPGDTPGSCSPQGISPPSTTISTGNFSVLFIF